jgi:hypothetical protein
LPGASARKASCVGPGGGEVAQRALGDVGAVREQHVGGEQRVAAEGRDEPGDARGGQRALGGEQQQAAEVVDRPRQHARLGRGGSGAKLARQAS